MKLYNYLTAFSVAALAAPTAFANAAQAVQIIDTEFTIPVFEENIIIGSPISGPQSSLAGFENNISDGSAEMAGMGPLSNSFTMDDYVFLNSNTSEASSNASPDLSTNLPFITGVDVSFDFLGALDLFVVSGTAEESFALSGDPAVDGNSPNPFTQDITTQTFSVLNDPLADGTLAFRFESDSNPSAFGPVTVGVTFAVPFETEGTIGLVGLSAYLFYRKKRQEAAKAKVNV